MLLFSSISPDLTRFGALACGPLWRLGRKCEETPPFLRQTSAWGRRIDQVVTCAAWRKQKEVAAEEGLISIAYEREYEEYSRLYQVRSVIITVVAVVVAAVATDALYCRYFKSSRCSCCCN